MRVLLIDIDSLRPDHLGCYGYARETSPTIDAIAGDGVRFESCFASDSPCLPSRTAMATGRFGAEAGAVTHYGAGQWLNRYRDPAGGGFPSDRPLTYRYLSESGVRTATVTSFGKRHTAYHYTGAFRESIQPTTGTGREEGTEVTDAALEWLDRNATDGDWLLHVNYWDVHHPYTGVDGLVDEVRDSGPAPAWPDEETLSEQQAMTGVRCASLWPSPDDDGIEVNEDGLVDHGEWDMPVRFDSREAFEHLVDGYDASIRKLDREVARLLEALDAAGVREDTAVVITGDHGEAMGEHGIYAEHAFAHPPCQRVPMIVSWPELTAGTDRSVTEKIYQFDLLATLCDLAGIEVPAGWDAEPFTAALRGEEFDGRGTLVCGHGIYTLGRAVYRDDWVYVRLLHPGVFSYPGLYNDPDLPGGGLELLHDLEVDPHMTENLLAERPDIAADLRSDLDEWKAENVPSREARGTDLLARMAATTGPFLYVQPEPLARYYREQGRSERAIEAVERARAFPLE